MPTHTRESPELLTKLKHGTATLCIIGIGRVGLPLAAVFAERGLAVIGIDRDDKYVSDLRNGRTRFKEGRLNDLLSAGLSSGKLELGTDIEKAVRRSDVVVVTVGTPVTERNNVNYSQVRHVLSSLVEAGIKGKALGFRSTLGPGTTDELIIPYLEESTGLRVGRDFYLAVCPERILEGHSIEELYQLPEIIGARDEASRAIFSTLFRKINAKKQIQQLSVTGAELAKLFTNIYRYVNFALANEFAIWSEKYGQDALEIITAANFQYSRSKIPRPGFAGGPCLAKDGFFLDNSVTFSSMISAAWKLNEAIPQHVADSIKKSLGGTLNGKIIGVLGIAYKAGIDDVRLSPAVKLVSILTELGAIVDVHDPYVVADTASLKSTLKDKDCIILAVNHPEFAKYKGAIRRSGCKLIYDVWGVFNRDDFIGSRYLRLGRGD